MLRPCVPTASTRNVPWLLPLRTFRMSPCSWRAGDLPPDPNCFRSQSALLGQPESKGEGESDATFGCDGGGARGLGGAGGGLCVVGRCLRRWCQPRYVADRHFGQLQQPGVVVLPEPGDGQP